MTAPSSTSRLEQSPSLFIYGEEQDFSNGWIYYHWALCGQYARPAIWGV